jgi:hypothetical protein
VGVSECENEYLHPYQGRDANNFVMPRGVSPKRERQYKKIARKAKKEGRYKGREKEVAARIVNKQRAKSGETKSRSRRKKKSTRSKR